MCLPCCDCGQVDEDAQNMPDTRPASASNCQQPPILPPIIAAPQPVVALPTVQYRLRVRVCYWQRQTTVVPNARIQVDHNNMPAPGGDNYADCGLFNAGMRTITVLRSAANPLAFIPRVDEQINLQNDQDLDVYVDQCVRVPLGIQTDLPFVETVDDTWIRFWTPTVVGSGAAGGHCMFLRCERDAETVTYHDGNPYAAGNQEDDWFFPPPGAAGWRYFKSQGAAQVTITLLEQA